ncbi:MAG: tetratricopeptide repeat protein [Treponema sp.]|nr:tetratricopeptide repeat protein [Candidatus Treponema equifaecale]
MPGLNQLKEFTDNIRKVGDEENIRAQRGEKPAEVPLPVGISEEDDSDDFLLGIPDGEETGAAESDVSVDDILSAINMDETVDVADIDSILAPQTDDETPDLSEFTDDLALPEDLTGAASADDVAVPEDLVSETPAADATDELNLDDLGLDQIADESAADATADLLADFDNLALDSLDTAETPEAAETDFDTSALDSLDSVDTAETADATETDFDTSALDELNDLNADFETNDAGIDLNADLPEELLMDDGVGIAEEAPAEEIAAEPESVNVEEAPAPDTDSSFGDFDTSALDSFDTPDSTSTDFDTSALDSLDTPDSTSTDFDTSALDSFDTPDSTSTDFDTSALDSLDTPDTTSTDFDTSALDSLDTPDTTATDFDTSALDMPEGGNDMSMFDTSDLDAGTGEIPDATMEVPGDDSFTSETEMTPETFDISEMDGMDFTPTAPQAGADEFPVTGEAAVDDFVLDSDFAIPGFSDTETADLNKKSSFLDTVDFSKGKAARPKNTLTDEEYKQFRKNLADYPLNLRLAVEDFIVKNEFTDDAVFEVIEKILKKTSARQVATQLEKMLDISINIPRDYERRSYAQYEAYKQSFQYQLKNRIIPAAIAGVILCFVCIGLFKASMKFIYNPVMASMNYKQGYTLLENNEFPQSEDKFKEAVSYKPVKKWFFKYANGYREKKQFDRAANMYKNTLRYFDHDLNAGLEYAEMELYDRANYERSEEIVRREILDYHINNPEGLLLLADTFLEWAEVDETKYEKAKDQYLDLIQRFGETNVYLSRMLRYYIRTDKLREVLVYKNIFYPNAKSLNSSDWTELSGYLLDKLYGELSLNDEYLRASIEDVRAMLEIAVKSNPANPVSRYNLARYFVFNGYTEQAKAELENSLDLFDNAAIRTKKNVYREINASRILGELYAGNREYLKAQTVYTRGVDLYNAEHEGTGLEGDSNTGRLFADLGDIDYFISGELDGALYNYERAIEIKNDTPSLNYRVGAIYYGRENYEKALTSFIKVAESDEKDMNVLLALGNVLALRNDNFAAQSYYSDLLSSLDMEKAKRKILLPQEDEDEGAIMEMYLRANNNLGVCLYKTARQTGNSQMNAQAMVRLTDSMRAWDSLTRNPRTMIRMEGSNLAAQNSKYITHPFSEFEPAIYTDIPKILSNEKVLE